MNFNKTCGKITMIAAIILLIISTSGCAKSKTVSKSKVENSLSQVEQFSTDFFTDCNLPYQKLQLTDVQNTVDEYLFYIENGAVYRTLNDYTVVIVERSELRESEAQIGIDYSGELYNIFEGDEIDVLQYSACGDYAIMASLITIPDWSNDEVITDFMEYAANYQKN